MTAVTTPLDEQPAPPAPPPARRPLPLPVAVPLAVAAGLAMLAAFPPYGWWPLAVLGVAGLAAASHRRRVRAGAGLGFLTGLALFAPLLSWTNLHTGNLPWLLLSLSQAAYLALLGATSAYTSPLVDRRPALWPAVTGLLWVGQEALRDRLPFGGFPWGRLAFSQGDSPLLRWAWLGGAPLVTLTVAVTGGLLVTLLWRSWRRPGLRAVVPAVGIAAVVGGALAVPVGMPRADGHVTVAIVQGNVPRLGLDFNAQRQAVLNNHVQATLRLAEQVTAGQARRPDLVVWPENSSDIDPLRDTTAGARISQAADAIGAPILVGAVLRGPGPGQVRNAGLLWWPGSGADTDQLYTKRHPVPFAEYVPMRDLARMVSSQVDRVRADFVPGDRPGVLRTDDVVLGDVICFEVAYDGIVRDTVTGGAQLLVVQTNNATFDESEALQQMAMVRLRAVEHGRDALMASTVGVSGFVAPDGRVDAATGFNTGAVVVRQMRLGAGHTPASRAGVWPEVTLLAATVVVLAGTVLLRRRRTVGPPGP